MKRYSLPPEPRALVFDIDNTLYSNDEYCTLQVELLVQRFARLKQISVAQAWDLIRREKELYSAKTDGGVTSTGNILAAFGVSLQESARWRDELFFPEDFVEYDEGTVAVIQKLAKTYKIAAVTNNTVGIGRRTLKCIGLDGLISIVIGLDTCYVSKPAAEPYEAALERLDTPASAAVSIGDRFDVDLAVPISMGMGGILIETHADLCELPAALPADQKE
jgi:phosphoglycolate phosphatase/putative hydrolase of the HAD superfamily